MRWLLYIFSYVFLIKKKKYILKCLVDISAELSFPIFHVLRTQISSSYPSPPPKKKLCQKLQRLFCVKSFKDYFVSKASNTFCIKSFKDHFVSKASKTTLCQTLQRLFCLKSFKPWWAKNCQKLISVKFFYYFVCRWTATSRCTTGARWPCTRTHTVPPTCPGFRRWVLHGYRADWSILVSPFLKPRVYTIVHN